MSNFQSSETDCLLDKIMKQINIIATLDPSPGYEWSQNYYREHGNFEGLEAFLKKKTQKNDNAMY